MKKFLCSILLLLGLVVPALADVNLYHTLFVDGATGSDTYSVRGDIRNPWKTLAAAKRAAATNDLIYVLPGNYAGTTDLTGRTWYFCYGVTGLTNTAHIDGAGDSAYNRNFYFFGSTNLSSVLGNGVAATYAYYTNAANNRWLLLDPSDSIWILGSPTQLIADDADYYSSDQILEHGPWNVQSGSGSVPLVHYFNPAIDPQGGVIAGDGSAITNLQTINLIGTIGASLLPYASLTNDGVTITNDYTWQHVLPNAQVNMERLPWRGDGPIGDEASVSNTLAWFRTIPLLRGGYNIIETEGAVYHKTRVVGAVSQYGTARHIVFNTTNFPSGLTVFKTIIHTNGFRWMAWYDPLNSTTLEQTLNFNQQLDDVYTVATQWQPDILWVDNIDPTTLRMFEAICTNNNILLMSAAQLQNITSMSHPMVRDMFTGNGWVPHTLTGDVGNWVGAITMANLMESSGWRYTGPGHCPWTGSGNLNNTDLTAWNVMTAMWSSHYIGPFNGGNGGFGFTTMWTNQSFLEIQGDPAVVCARRVLVTNDLWCLLKPLDSPGGPNFALAIINTNNSVAKSATIPWTELNNAGQQSLLTLRDSTYSVFDMKGNAAVGDAQSQVAVTSLASHDYLLYKLISTNRIFKGQVLGMADGSAAPAGSVGEQLSQTRLRSAASSAITATPLNVTATALSLTPGDWDVTAVVGFLPAASTTITRLDAAVSTTSATLPGTDTIGVPDANGQVRAVFDQAASVAGADITLQTVRSRVSVSATTSYYLVAQSSFAVSTMTVYGSITARRVR